MKFRFVAALTLAGLVGTTASAWAGPTLDRITKAGELVNVVDNSYPPFSYINENNEVVGFDIDIAKAVADRLGVKLRIETPGWETIVGGKWQGRWDICICSMTPTDQRAQVLDFPLEYYRSPAVLVVNKDEKAIQSAADLDGKRVGVGTGSTYEAYLDKSIVIPGAKPIVFPFKSVIKVPTDETVAFQDLALGAGVRLDAVVANLATTKERIDAGAPVRIVGKPLYGEPNWVAVDKGDPQWNAKVVETINALRADGTLKAISDKWLGADVTAGDF